MVVCYIATTFSPFYAVGTSTRYSYFKEKDGTKIGTITHFPREGPLEIGFATIPDERSKGYCTEAVKIIVDYLFLPKNIVRIQAQTNPRNIQSQKVLEKAGFKKEGLIRKSTFIRGE